MNCWKILGLAADADERAIKRSYAALLKVHRPDEDLEAFQRLREAYEQALSIAKRRERKYSDAVSVADAPMSLHGASRSSIADALVDLSPANLDSVGARAKATGHLVEFERLLLERCLSDNEQGYQAARWALERLAWLTPWQSPELPAVQLEDLVNRLMATELHDLRRTLASGDEQAFLVRVRVLYEQRWLQAFDRRAAFSHGVAGVLADSTGWSQPLFDSVSEVFGWSEESLGWETWELFAQRSEGVKLKARLLFDLNAVAPSDPYQRAAWMLLKPLKDVDRRRLVDEFGAADWQSCFQLEQALGRYPDVLGELGSSEVYPWRMWLPKGTREATYQYLLAMFMSIFWLSSSLNGWVWEMGLASIAPLLLSLVVFFLLRIFVIASFDFHEGWSEFYRKAVGLDLYLSRVLLSDRLVRGGLGILIFRHIVPALYLGFCAWLMACIGPSAIAPFVGAAVALLALWYVDRVSRGWVPKPLFSANFEVLGYSWAQVGIGIFAVAVFVAIMFFGFAKESAGKDPRSGSDASTLNSLFGECTWTKQYNGECEMPPPKQSWNSAQ